jgi:hypothetical protein
VGAKRQDASIRGGVKGSRGDRRSLEEACRRCRSKAFEEAALLKNWSSAFSKKRVFVLKVKLSSKSVEERIRNVHVPVQKLPQKTK